MVYYIYIGDMKHITPCSSREGNMEYQACRLYCPGKYLDMCSFGTVGTDNNNCAPWRNEDMFLKVTEAQFENMKPVVRL